MDHPKEKGDRTTLAVMLALKVAGFTIAEPFGENTRYDLIVDDGSGLTRVQCKTGRLRGGAVHFALCSCYGHHRNPGQARRAYHGEVDYFGVYCSETGGVYLVPVAHCGQVHASLRIAEPRNNQRQGVRFARDYLIAEINVSLMQPALGRLAA